MKSLLFQNHLNKRDKNIFDAEIQDFISTIQQIIRISQKDDLQNKKIIMGMAADFSCMPVTLNVIRILLQEDILSVFVNAANDYEKKKVYKASLITLMDDHLISNEAAALYLNDLAQVLWGGRPGKRVCRK